MEQTKVFISALFSLNAPSTHVTLQLHKITYTKSILE